MNKSELIDCFNAISPTDEQKEKMLAQVLKYKEKSFKPTAILKYSAAFAAVLVFGIFLSIYPQLKNFDKEERAQETYSHDSGKYNTEDKVKPDTVEKSEDKIVSSEKESKKTVTGKSGVKSETVLPEKSTEAVEETENTQEQNMALGEAPKTEEENNANIEALAGNDGEDADSSAIPEKEEENSQTEKMLRSADNQKAASGSSALMAPSTVNEDENEVNAYSYDMDASDDSVSMKTIQPQEDSKTELTKDEIMQHEVYKNLFPKRIISGYRFAFAEEYDDSMLNAAFESDNGYMYIKIFSIKDSDYSVDTILPEELKSYAEVEYITFSIQCKDYIVSYEISGENIKGIYDMVVSSDYFNK